MLEENHRICSKYFSPSSPWKTTPIMTWLVTMLMLTILFEFEI